MIKENIPEVPWNLASLLIARRRYTDLARLIVQTTEVLSMYDHLICDTVACIQEMPDNIGQIQQLQELLQAARTYTECHHRFTQQLDVETSFRRNCGPEFPDCMVAIISQRQHLQQIATDIEKKYASIALETNSTYQGNP